MSELIVRMARRLAGHYGQPFDLLAKNKDEVRRWMRDGLPPQVASAMGGTRWDHNDPTQEDHIQAARDALAAVREPTEAMVDSGSEAMSDVGSTDPVGAGTAWSAMIDEALR